jgi:hypothetical protein
VLGSVGHRQLQRLHVPEQRGVQVEALNPEVHALRQAQPATLPQRPHQTVGRLQLTDYGLGLGVG